MEAKKKTSEALSAWQRMGSTKYAARRLCRLDGPTMTRWARATMGILAKQETPSIKVSVELCAEPAGSWKWQSKHHYSLRLSRLTGVHWTGDTCFPVWASQSIETGRRLVANMGGAWRKGQDIEGAKEEMEVKAEKVISILETHGIPVF